MEGSVTTIDNPATLEKRSAGLILNPLRQSTGRGPIALPMGRHEIGSDPACSVYLPLSGVEAKHCLLIIGPTKWVVRSWSRFTWLNDGVVRDSVLRAGDKLSVGPIEFEIQQPKRRKDRLDETPRRPAEASLEAATELSLREALDDTNHQLASQLARLEAAQLRYSEVEFETERTRKTLSAAKDTESAIKRRAQLVNELRDDLRQQLDDLLQRESAATQNAQALHESTEKLETRSRTLEERLSALEQSRREVDARQAALEQQRAEAESLRAGLLAGQNALEEDRRRLTNETADIEAQRLQLDEQIRQAGERTEAVAANEQRIADRETEIAARQAELDQRSTQLENQAAELSRRSEELASSEQAAAQRSEEARRQRAEVEELRTALAQERAALETARGEHTAAVAEADSHRESLNQQALALQSRDESLLEQSRESERRIAELHQHSESLRDREEAIRREEESLAMRERDLAECEETLARDRTSLKEDCRAINEARAALDVERATLEASREETAVWQRRLNEERVNLEQRMAESDARETERQEQWKNCEHRIAEITARGEELDQSAATLASHFETLGTREQELFGQDASLGEWRQTLVAERNEINDQLRHLDDNRRHLEQQFVAAANDRESLAHHRAELEERGRLIREQEEAHARRETALAEWAEELGTGNTALAGREQAILAQEQDLAEIQIAIDLDRTQIQDDRQSLEEGREQLAAARDRLQRDQSELAEQRAEADRRREELAELTAAHEQRSQDLQLEDQRQAARQAEHENWAAELQRRAELVAGREDAAYAREVKISDAEAFQAQERERINTERTQFEETAAALMAERSAFNEECRLFGVRCEEFDAGQQTFAVQLADLNGRSEEARSLREANELRAAELLEQARLLDERTSKLQAQEIRFAEQLEALEGTEAAAIASIESQMLELEAHRRAAEIEAARSREALEAERRLIGEQQQLLSRERDELAAQRQIEDTRVAELTLRVTEQEAIEAELRQHSEQTLQKFVATEQARNAEAAEAASLRTTIETLQFRIAERETHFAQECSEREAERHLLNEELSAVRDALATAEKTITERNQTHAEQQQLLESERQEWDLQVQGLAGRIAELQAIESDLHQQADLAIEEIRTSRIAHGQVESRASALQNDVDQLRAELAATMDRMREQQSTHESNQAAMQDVLAQLQRELADERNASEETRRNWDADRSDRDTQILGLTGRVAELQQVEGDYHEYVERATQELAAVQNSYASEAFRASELQNAVGRLQEELQAAAARLDEQRSGYEFEIENSHHAIAQLKSEFESHRQAADDQAQQHARESAEHHEERGNLSTWIEQLTSRISELEAFGDESRAQAEISEQELRTARELHQAETSRVESLLHDIEQLQSEIQSSDRRLVEMKSTIEMDRFAAVDEADRLRAELDAERQARSVEKADGESVRQELEARIQGFVGERTQAAEIEAELRLEMERATSRIVETDAARQADANRLSALRDEIELLQSNHTALGLQHQEIGTASERNRQEFESQRSELLAALQAEQAARAEERDSLIREREQLETDRRDAAQRIDDLTAKLAEFERQAEQNAVAHASQQSILQPETDETQALREEVQLLQWRISETERLLNEERTAAAARAELQIQQFAEANAQSPAGAANDHRVSELQAELDDIREKLLDEQEAFRKARDEWDAEQDLLLRDRMILEERWQRLEQARLDANSAAPRHEESQHSAEFDSQAAWETTNENWNSPKDSSYDEGPRSEEFQTAAEESDEACESQHLHGAADDEGAPISEEAHDKSAPAADDVLQLRSQLAELFGIGSTPVRSFDEELPPADEIDEQAAAAGWNEQPELEVAPEEETWGAEAVEESTETDLAETAQEPEDSFAEGFEESEDRNSFSSSGNEETSEGESHEEIMSAYLNRLLGKTPEMLAAKPTTPEPAPVEAPAHAEAEPETQSPRAARRLNPEEKETLRANLDSFRELANMQARAAVAKHRSNELKSGMQLTSVAAILVSVVAVVLLTAEFWSPTSYRREGLIALGIAATILVWMLLNGMRLRKLNKVIRPAQASRSYGEAGADDLAGEASAEVETE